MVRLRKALAALVLVIGPLGASLPAAAQDQGDPPADVARIAVVSGSVAIHQPGSQAEGTATWQAAQQNYPLAPGGGVWTEPRSHAAVDVAGARIHLDASSQLEVTAIQPGQVRLAVPQGAAYLHVYPGVSGVGFEIDTAHGAAYINQPGQYEIVAGDDQHPSTLSVVEGQAQLVGQNANLALQPGQRGTIDPTGRAGVDAAQPDDFVRMVQAAEQPYQQQLARTAQYVSPQQTGYQDLARYGQWSQAPQYGAVWYPQAVPVGWAPYRYGHWAYVAPWGWTWVDDQPWGFTPFHYGRWVMIGPRWAWVPGVRVARPVYAPALVTFFNLGGVGVSLSLGWVPLGPDEVYVPAYRHSPNYVRAVNITNVRNETTIVNVVNRKTVINVNNYRNYRGATSVSRDVVAQGRPVDAAWGKPDKAKLQQQWTHARPEREISLRPQGNAAPKPTTGPKYTPQQQRDWQRPGTQSAPKQTAPVPSNKAVPQSQPRKTWDDNGKQKGNGPKPNNGAPQPYYPPAPGSSQNFNAPASKPRASMPVVAKAPVAPKPSKAAAMPQWNGQAPNNPASNTRNKKNQQSPAVYSAVAPKPAVQPNPKQEQAAKKAQWEAQQQTRRQQTQPQNQRQAQQMQRQQQQEQQRQAQQQWKQHGQPNPDQHSGNASKGNQPPRQQQRKPIQDCGQQQGACSQ